jgi:hypothetical protein
MKFIAIIRQKYYSETKAGPTSTRDAAARLAEAVIANLTACEGGGQANPIRSVEIEQELEDGEYVVTEKYLEEVLASIKERVEKLEAVIHEMDELNMDNVDGAIAETVAYLNELSGAVEQVREPK